MNFIGPLDQKPFYGVAIAVVAGLMLGGAMKPTLKVGGPEGPQMLGAQSGPRVQFVDSRTSTDAYRYGIPEWVIGTDWTRPRYQEPAPAPQEREPESYEVAAWEPPEPRMVAVSEPEPEPAEPVYPSMSGDILQGVGAPPPPEEPAAEAAAPEPIAPVAG